MIETVLGVATGFLGTILTSFTNLKTQKLKNEHELKMRNFDIQERKQEAELQIAVETARTEAAIDTAEAAAYTASLQTANLDVLTAEKLQVLSQTGGRAGKILSFLMGLVDTFRASIRPGLTVYLVVLTTILTFKAIEILSVKQSLLSPEQARELFNQVSDVIIYLTISVVTWWFGDRRTAKFLYRLNDGNVQDKKGY
ncbi:MAG: hypothetical protein FD166_1471 [Bacteroidetes bacterium]|nr:MAG: hypothetical protein FD166_1471 [Bacteroidota bacterium]